MSVDLRVRRSGDLGCVEFRAFHERKRRVVYLGCSLPGAAPDASTKRIRDRAGRVTYAPGAN